MDLQAYIRDIPDFPEPGIIFKDITPLLQDVAAFRAAVDAMAEPFRGAAIDAVVAIEARGYILGAPLAFALGVGFVPVRKIGKLPFHTYRVEYELEYGTGTLEVHQDALVSGQRALIVDDVLATGGTLEATVKLVGATGASVVGATLLGELPALGGRARLPGIRVEVLLQL